MHVDGYVVESEGKMVSDANSAKVRRGSKKAILKDREIKTVARVAGQGREDSTAVSSSGSGRETKNESGRSSRWFKMLGRIRITQQSKEWETLAEP
jgi:hypothetical protein